MTPVNISNMDSRILNITDNLNSYELHLVPCKVRYEGPTEEFVASLETYMTNTDDTYPNKTVTYLRGRKLVGEQLNIGDRVAYLAQTQEDSDGNMKIVTTSTISRIVNYEREGNETRLENELKHFEEFQKVSAIIHS